jgi:hypothetical protein
MYHAAIPKGIGHCTHVVAPACMRACRKSGGVPQHLPSLCHRRSAPGVILILSTIAAERAVVLFRFRHRNPLYTLANSRKQRYRVSVNNRCNLLRVSVNSHWCRPPVSGRIPLRPVLPIKACSLPGHHQLLLVATGETMKQNHKVFAARPVVRTVRGCDLLLL